MNRPEEALQRAVVDFLNLHERQLSKRCIWFHVPNQKGNRTRAEMGALRATGVRPGVADLVFIFDPGKALCIELKAPGREGNLSPAQNEFLEACMRTRTPYYVESSVEGVRDILVKHGILDKARER